MRQKITRLSQIAVYLGLNMIPNIILGQSENCYEKMREGKFELTTERADGYYIIRKKKKQIEVFNYGKSKMVFKIDWKTENVYTLTTHKLINTPEHWDEKKGDVTTVTMFDCQDSIYSCKSERDGKPITIFRFIKIDS